MYRMYLRVDRILEYHVRKAIQRYSDKHRYIMSDESPGLSHEGEHTRLARFGNWNPDHPEISVLLERFADRVRLRA